MTQTRRFIAPFLRLIAGALALAAIALPAQASVPKRKPEPPPQTCLDHILATEQELALPSGMLLSVALSESGRNGTPASYALNIHGRAHFPANEREAARLLRDDQGRLRRNVFAGCMQLSVQHHQAAFRPVERIVNPGENVRYAANYLIRLKRETGSWAGALARYNGGQGAKRTAYVCRIQHQMTALGSPDAGQVTAANCRPSDQGVEVAPKTRRAYRLAAGLPLS